MIHNLQLVRSVMMTDSYINTIVLRFYRSISRVPGQNGASQTRYIVEIQHSGRKPSICLFIGFFSLLHCSRRYLSMVV